MPEFAAHITTTTHIQFTDPMVDTLVEALAPVHGAAGTLAGHLDARITIHAHDLPAAATTAHDLITDLLHQLGLGGEVDGVTVQTTDAFDRTLGAPRHPTDLITTAEAADLLGVSRQRILQLAADHPGFPTSVRHGRAHLWSADAVRRFDTGWDRRPGRPATITA